MEVDEKAAKWKSEYKGEDIFLLCSYVQAEVR